MIDKYIRMHLDLAKNRQKTSKKIISLIFVWVIFLILIPILLIPFGRFITKTLTISLSREIEIIISILLIATGLFFYIWTNIVQWRIGKGTIAISAPTQKLVTKGPYKLCRNPLELGAVLYYFGIGILFGSFKIGFFMFGVMFTLGSLYHKLIEEKELELRFGDSYREYKKKTPFILPKVSIRKRRC